MAQAGGPGRRSQGRPRPKGPPRADGPTSKPKALPARPGGPKYRKSATGIEVATRGRPTMVRLGELVLLAGCLAFLYIPVSHYLKTGKWPNLLSSRGWSVIETGVAEGRENLKESYGYIKDRLPQTTGELRAWLEDRGQKLASTEELLAMASKAAEAMELEATPDAGAGGVSTEVSDAKREEFRRRQEARAERREREFAGFFG